ncbi:export ABC transporter ATP-binding protein [Corynebacterium yudongzhengii]|uniref:Export ABC transporter ATP-binding protein n=1 Tax=Corynebacterium yudongzhengii TaxID=2080740 RepID=A0A2U1T4W1_9CORY|nr:ATP-binding cassette domain-containing protein [Corynebacterium yudongzhengii]AWB82676.1 export ABC transporter ATP-binding protein [Corynebacterium yudongzhengii]PWC01022.1 export ABC transporter ATP-binding protein [Corynebacterium yudongzhengii]
MIHAVGLTKQYKNVTAVDDLTFDVKPGVVTGFLGPNGAGKSTTMRMIVGLDNPTSGTVTIGGENYRDLKRPLEKVGALLDAKSVHPNRSAAAHLRWIAQSNGLPTSRVDEVLGLVGLSDVAGKKAGGFSLGMGQRLGLAGALLGDPEVLILDEPVNGLDPEGIRWVRGLMQALAAEGRTVLVSSHLLSEMAQTAENLLVIGRGRLIADTRVRDFIRDHSATTVLVRTPYVEEFSGALDAEGIAHERQKDEEGRDQIAVPDATSDDIGALAYSTGVLLTELTEKSASLEDAFFEMTQGSVQYRAAGAGADAGAKQEGR